MEKQKRFNQKLKNILLFILAVAIFLSLGIAGPFAIIWAYNEPDKVIYAPWEAADVLSYYGVLLGAIATIAAVVLTINYSRKSAEKDRQLSENNNYRNYGIQYCTDLLDICNYLRITDIIQNASILIIKNEQDKYYYGDYNFAIKTGLVSLKSSMTNAYSKFIKFHFNLLNSEKKEILEFIKIFNEITDTLISKCFVTDETKEFVKLDEENEELMSKHLDWYSKFQEYMYKLVFNYDYTEVKREKTRSQSQNNQNK
ncbi:hypothetical protein [Acetobacterium bakii]|uniref:Uncharacterized protein n=1 Tax=Acetobacterium bakii TaxID=52689 RepID=A0A0L6TWN7_9FIRM|nr:hypothetical protein [Acetobacterium bakii]KNZ40684.1 hypothetical protein AKG39_16345 [Acetobacterium bakii]